MKKIFFILSILICVVHSQAWANNDQPKAKRVLMVSDIDDTIKVSHVLSPIFKVGRASDITTPFRGMSDLYQIIKSDLQNQSIEFKLVYLSNAPKEILGWPALELSHQTFLKFNNFPEGELSLRESIFDNTHKVNELRRLIDSFMPDMVILIGDNGESDPLYYKKIVDEYSVFPIEFKVFIHQLYKTKADSWWPRKLQEIGSEVQQGQESFVTPIEIYKNLIKLQLIDQKKHSDWAQNLIQEIMNESDLKWDGLRPISFPYFKNCRDFTITNESDNSWNSYELEIHRRCH